MLKMSLAKIFSGVSWLVPVTSAGLDSSSGCVPPRLLQALKVIMAVTAAIKRKERKEVSDMTFTFILIY